MTKKSLILDLPYLASSEIIKHMDTRSRFKLAQCSTRAKQTVSIVPLVYTKVQLTVSRNNTYLKTFDQKNSGIIQIGAINSIMDIQDLVTILERIFFFKNTKIKYLHIEAATKMEKRDQILSLINTWLSSLKHNLTIESAHFALWDDEDYALAFLPHFKPGVLKTMTFKGVNYPKLTKVVQTEQWKQATRVVMDDTYVPIRSFQAIPHFVSRKFLKAIEVEALIEDMLNFGAKERVFQSPTNPFNSNFTIPYDYNPENKIYTFRRQGMNTQILLPNILAQN